MLTVHVHLEAGFPGGPEVAVGAGKPGHHAALVVAVPAQVLLVLVPLAALVTRVRHCTHVRPYDTSTLPVVLYLQIIIILSTVPKTRALIFFFKDLSVECWILPSSPVTGFV